MSFDGCAKYNEVNSTLEHTSSHSGAAATAKVPFDIASHIIYRDALILVLNKPSNMPVHKGSGPYTPLSIYFDDLRFGLPRVPELAHRLDKDTSGCLVLGRNAHALSRLGHIFQKGAAQKIYHALVHGDVAQNEGVIDAPLGKQSQHRSRWWMKVDPKGKPAVTHYRVLNRFKSYTYLELVPITGRTHQLRVHCQALGHPIVNDKIYGVSFEDASKISVTHHLPSEYAGDEVSRDVKNPHTYSQQTCTHKATFANEDIQNDIPHLTSPCLHLHAQSITLPLYPKKEPLIITAPCPSYMKQWAPGA